MINKTETGIEDCGLDTPDKTLTNAFTGFASGIVTQQDRRVDNKVRCGKCGADDVKLYAGGTGRLSSLCIECMWPRREEKSDNADVGTYDAETSPSNVKVIRLIHCYACQQARPPSAMSNVPVICRDCLTNDGSRLAKLRIEQGILRINRAIRRFACL